MLRGINFVKTPLVVSIPKVRGLMSTGTSGNTVRSTNGNDFVDMLLLHVGVLWQTRKRSMLISSNLARVRVSEKPFLSSKLSVSILMLC